MPFSRSVTATRTVRTRISEMDCAKFRDAVPPLKRLNVQRKALYIHLGLDCTEMNGTEANADRMEDDSPLSGYDIEHHIIVFSKLQASRHKHQGSRTMGRIA